ncbi:MAG: nucleoside recognition protein [Lachnospiraceae bacterium]|nr:nucleoside recognition protein [Lachnospiraceae bacterium]
MLNYLWAFMILTGIIYGCFHGTMAEISNAALDSAKEAVNLCITMLGVMSFWTGLMQIAQKAGIIASLTQKITPFLRFLFPSLRNEQRALEYISTNVIANILGLGWACTPAGLKAMEEMRQIQLRCGKNPDIASNEMCGFLILNISSLQLIPVNMIVYRSQYGSVNPTAIIAPAILATSFSTLAGILFLKIADARSRRHNY